MKRTLLFNLCLFSVLGIFAQGNAIETYFKGHLENPAFEKFEVSERTFELANDIDTDDAEEQRVLDAVAEIDGVTVLANKKTPISGEYYQDAMDKLTTDERYEDLVILETNEANARFLIRENEERIQEFVGVIAADEHFIIASLYGNIDVSSLSRIMQVFKNGNIEWLENFHNLHSEQIVFGDKNPSIEKAPDFQNSKISINDLSLSIYPNPATDFININAENGENAVLNLSFYSLLGKEIQQIGKVNLPYKVELQDLPAGTYFMRLTDKTGTFKNFKIVKPTLR